MKRAVPLVKPRLTKLLLGVSVLALSACAEQVATTTKDTAAPSEAQTSKNKNKTAPKTAAKAKDVPAPTAFAATDTAIWDGRPTLGAIWVAHPDAPQAERVEIVNQKTGKRVTGALFTRKTKDAGPPIQLSAEAARALGVGPGQTTTLAITAIRPSNEVPLPDDAAIKVAEVTAKKTIWGDEPAQAEPAPEPPIDQELLIAAAQAPMAAPTANASFVADVPMGVFPDYDAALIVQARLSQAGVRSEIRESFLDEVIFYQVYAEQADSKTMIAEAPVSDLAPDADIQMAELAPDTAEPSTIRLPSEPEGTLLAGATAFSGQTLPDEGPVTLRLAEAVVVAQLNAPQNTLPSESALALKLPGAESLAKAEPVAPLVVASVSEGEAMSPFLSFDAAVQFAANSLALPQVFDQTGIAIPTKASSAPVETLPTSKLAHVNYSKAPMALAKGKTTELLAELVRPSAPAQDKGAHVRIDFTNDAVERGAAPNQLSIAAQGGPDTPLQQTERAGFAVMAALSPMPDHGLTATDAAPKPALSKLGTTSRPAPRPLANASPAAAQPKRPTARNKVSLQAKASGPAVIELPQTSAVALAAVEQVPAYETAPDILVAALSPSDLGSFASPEPAAAPGLVRPRATPRRQRVAKLRTSTALAGVLEINVTTVRDATNLNLAAVPVGAGPAELPNFGVFGAGIAGGDGGSWFDQDLLSGKRFN